MKLVVYCTHHDSQTNECNVSPAKGGEGGGEEEREGEEREMGRGEELY